MPIGLDMLFGDLPTNIIFVSSTIFKTTIVKLSFPIIKLPSEETKDV